MDFLNQAINHMDIIKTTTYDKGEEGWKSLLAAMINNTPNPTGFEPTLEGEQYPQQTLKLKTSRRAVPDSQHITTYTCNIAANAYDGAAIHVFSDLSVGLVVNMVDREGKTHVVMLRGKGITLGDNPEDVIKEGLKYQCYTEALPEASGQEDMVMVDAGEGLIYFPCGPCNSKHTEHEEDCNG